MVARPTPPSHVPYGNAPLLTHAWRDFVIEGWSRAGVQTYWRIPQWKLALDQGNHPWELANAQHLALTHFHADHAAGLVSFLSTRSLLGLPPPRVYFPAAYAPALREYLAAWKNLSTDDAKAELVPLEHGDVIALGGRRELVAFPTVHTVPSLGYLVRENRTRLRPEYAGLSEHEIGMLRRGGADVSEQTTHPLLAYCGDTTIATLDRTPFLYDVPVLLLETTFYGESPTPEASRRYGHVHVRDLAERAGQFRNELLVLAHVSNRHDAAHAQAALEEVLPPDLLARIVLWL